MLISFIMSGLFGGLSVCVIIVMIKVKIEKRKNREYVVKLYKALMGCSYILMVVSMGFLLIYFYTLLYNMFLNLCMFVSKSPEFSEYIALSIILVTFQPAMYFILKIAKRNLYKKKEQNEMQEAGTDMINKVIRYINEIPVKGIIHIINLILVVLANSFKVLNVDTNLTTTSIYMSVATFYALDRVVDYFSKKYSFFWKKVDNKLFDTEKIDSNVKFGLNDLNNIKEKLFTNYIETGIYNLPEQ